MSDLKPIWDIADSIFESGNIYYWTMNGSVVWACKAMGPGPQLNQ